MAIKIRQHPRHRSAARLPKLTLIFFTILASWILLCAIPLIRQQYQPPHQPALHESPSNLVRSQQRNVVQQKKSVEDPTIPRTAVRLLSNVVAKTDDDWWLYRVDTTNLTHPHLGARHPNGTLGMVVNPSVERLESFKKSPQEMIRTFTPPRILCPASNLSSSDTYHIEGSGGIHVLQKIRRGLVEAQGQLANNNMGPAKKVRILCMIYTVHKKGEENYSLKAIAETWGKDCDGFIAASNVTDHKMGAIDLMHQGPEEYGNMWQKIRSMWTYAYDHYINDYDFFYIAGDDTFVLVDHLRFYLTSNEIKRLEEGYLDRVSQYHKDEASITAQWRPRPLVLATPLFWKNAPSIAGGPGYVLNAAALRLWGKKGGSWYADAYDSREDILMSAFFMSEQVYLSDTQDEAGGWRFSRSAQGASEFNGMNSPIVPLELERKYGFHIGIGADWVSKNQISFHLKKCKPALRSRGFDVHHLMYRYHAFFHSWCPSDD